jgi:hypothetical protein
MSRSSQQQCPFREESPSASMVGPYRVVADDAGSFLVINSGAIRSLRAVNVLPSMARLLVRLSPVPPYRRSAFAYQFAVFSLAVPRSSIAVYLAPECQRLHGIIKCVVSADKMTSPPSKMIPSSINNLSIWYSERAPISYRLHLFGCPSHCPLSHNFQYYNTRNSSFTLILFLSNCHPFAL